MATKTKTIILDENKAVAFFENIELTERNVLNKFLKECTIVKNQIPDEQVFVDFGLHIFQKLGKNSSDYEYSLKAKYYQWKEDGWIDGYGTPIRNWKTKLANTVAKLSPVYKNKNTTDTLLNNLVVNGIPEF